MHRSLYIFGIAIVLDVAVATAQTVPSGPVVSQPKNQAGGGTAALGYVPNHVLVRFQDSSLEAAQGAAAHQAMRATAIRTFSTVRNLELVELPDGADIVAAAAAYRRMPGGPVRRAGLSDGYHGGPRRSAVQRTVGPAQHRTVRRNRGCRHRCAGGVEHHDRQQRRRRRR